MDGEAPVLTTVSTSTMEITRCFAFLPRFRLAPNRFSKTIDAFLGCLYSQRSYLSRRPRGKHPSDEIGITVKIPLDFLNNWPPWPFESPMERG
jgi:hypothetical protein